MIKIRGLRCRQGKDGLGPVVHGKQFGYYFHYEGKTQEHFKQISNNLIACHTEHLGGCGEYSVEGKSKKRCLSR